MAAGLLDAHGAFEDAEAELGFPDIRLRASLERRFGHGAHPLRLSATRLWRNGGPIGLREDEVQRRAGDSARDKARRKIRRLVDSCGFLGLEASFSSSHQGGLLHLALRASPGRTDPARAPFRPSSALHLLFGREGARATAGLLDGLDLKLLSLARLGARSLDPGASAVLPQDVGERGSAHERLEQAAWLAQGKGCLEAFEAWRSVAGLRPGDGRSFLRVERSTTSCCVLARGRSFLCGIAAGAGVRPDFSPPAGEDAPA